MGQLPPVATTPEIVEAIQANSPIAIGVSGGKDSCALAFAVRDHLDSVGHTGPRVLIHSDLGRVEWKDSLPTCKRLAEALGYELMIVQRKAGDMMDRWLSRWAANVDRYENLACVKLILPWSTPSMRFCTSELKTAVICSNLKKRFGGLYKDTGPTTIVNAVGIRRQESKARAKKPISKTNKSLFRKTDKTNGLDWNAIIEWSEEDVFAIAKQNNFDMHEAYKVFGSSRVSCAFCMLATVNDHSAAISDERNVDVWKEMVDLEIRSSFSFQSNRWLGDLKPELLSKAQQTALDNAKCIAKRREAWEQTIPKELHYVKGWPTFVPSTAQCWDLAHVRRRINELLQFDCKYLAAKAVRDRYAELYETAQAKLKVSS